MSNMLVDEVLDKINIEHGSVIAWVFTDRSNFGGIRIKGQDEILCRVSTSHAVGEEVLLTMISEALLDQMLFSKVTPGYQIRTWADFMHKYFTNEQ